MRLPRLGRVGLLLLPLLMLALPLGAFTLTFGLFGGGGFVGFTLVPPKRAFGRWRRICAVDQVWSFACVSVPRQGNTSLRRVKSESDVSPLKEG